MNDQVWFRPRFEIFHTCMFYVEVLQLFCLIMKIRTFTLKSPYIHVHGMWAVSKLLKPFIVFINIWGLLDVRAALLLLMIRHMHFFTNLVLLVLKQ